MPAASFVSNLKPKKDAYAVAIIPLCVLRKLCSAWRKRRVKRAKNYCSQAVPLLVRLSRSELVVQATPLGKMQPFALSKPASFLWQDSFAKCILLKYSIFVVEHQFAKVSPGRTRS